MLTAICTGLVLASSLSAQTLTLPFYEGFEPVGGDPGNCATESRGNWGYQNEWKSCNANPVGPDCPDDPYLTPCVNLNTDSRCWGPYKFESYPDLCAGGHVYAGYRAVRQPIHDPAWFSMFHPFELPSGTGTLMAEVMFYDSTSILCECECNCDPEGPTYGYPNGRPNYQIQAYLTIQNPERSEGYALGINTYSSWVNYSWYTKTDGWHSTGVPRTPGWHKLEILVHPWSGGQDVEFRIDGVTVANGQRRPPGSVPPVSWLRIGGDPALITENHLANTFQQIWYDEVRLDFVPATCHASRSDLDGDGDVDVDDFGAFQLCYTGAGKISQFDAATCHCVDYDGDMDVDDQDFAVFNGCSSRAGVPAIAGCGD